MMESNLTMNQLKITHENQEDLYHFQETQVIVPIMLTGEFPRYPLLRA